MQLIDNGNIEIVVFTGPTLSHAEGRKILPKAHFLDPAMQGDIFEAFQTYKPSIIILIDGYYENVPSVWHKEILYVMSQGCHVYGAASMGALRATELHDFGMQGHGKIFEWFQSGLLEDDDEVALLHGPGEIDYLAISEPLVNIRATIEQGIRQEILTPEIALQIVSVSKSIFYKLRSYKHIREKYSEVYPVYQAAYIFDWMEENKINQKKIDASSLLTEISFIKRDEMSEKKVLYNFSETIYWRRSIELPN